MSKALTNPAFDYESVSSDEAGKLRYFEAQLLSSRKRVADELIKHGEILHGAQQLLANHSNGVFVAWLDSCGISQRSAYNAISAFVAFASFANLQNLEVSAMYVLATNEAAKKKALRLADKGVKVTHAMAKQLIEQHKPAPAATTQAAVVDSDPALFHQTRTDDGDTSYAGEDAEPERIPEEPTATPPRNGTDQRADSEDYGKCPACAGIKWTEDAEGWIVCAKCGHYHGEPAGDVDSDRLGTQRAKTVKTVEALMRAFDDLHAMLAKQEHGQAIASCKQLLELARGWK